MTRKFDIGRQNEVLMSQSHYDIFKIMQYYLNFPSDASKGPETFTDSDEIMNGALWLDRYSNPDSADIKYFNNGVWDLLFNDRFKLICDILSKSEPTNPIEGQLWINSLGILNYYKSGQFIPIKSTLSDTEDIDTSQYEDFLVINPLDCAEHAVLNNFSKFLFANTPIEQWTAGREYYYQQGVTDSNGNLYVCNRQHYSSQSNTYTNPYYWSRIDSLLQFLLPNANTDKVFVNGIYLHQREGTLDGSEETVYKSVAITFSAEDTSVIHDTLRFDVLNDSGYYDEATLILESDISNPDVTPAESTVVQEPIEIDEGYIKNTNIAIYIPDVYLKREKDSAGNYINDEYTYGSDAEYKLVTAVHVNPIKLDKITKYFVRLDKTTKIVNIPKENTEFYGISNGVGKLLLETIDERVFDYCGVLSNGQICIKVSDNVATSYDYIYAIHYDFVETAKTAGKLYRKKVHLNDVSSIYLGQQDSRKLAVYAQGLFYQQADNTYEYNYDDEYLYFKERLLTSSSDRLEISVINFPNIFKGKITTDNYVDANFIAGKGYRIDLNAIPYNADHCLGFISGIQVNPKEDIVFDPADTTAVYFPNITKQYVIDHGDEIDWIIAETDFIENSTVTQSMYRGRTSAIAINSEIGINITRDVNVATNDMPYLNYTESPIVFVDGILIAQKDVSIYENYISIPGLTVGQDVVMLADINSNITLDDVIEKTEIITKTKNYDPSLALEEDATKLKLIEDMTSLDNNVDLLTSFIYEDARYLHQIYNFNILSTLNSDNVLFEDNISNISIKTPNNDDAIIYLKDGLLCDTNAVTVTKLPADAFEGEIKHLFNTVQDEWYVYTSNVWTKIEGTELDSIVANADGYTSYNTNVSIIKDLVDEKYCTYFAYIYSDTVEKPLLTGFIDPDGQTGINDGLSDFQLGVKHYYVPGRNELTVYLNGIRQNLTSPFEDNYDTSLARECDMTGTNTFALSFDNGTTVGEAIKAQDGYYTYKTVQGGIVDYMYKTVQLTDAEVQTIKDSGINISLISSPNPNSIFYVVEPCETGESMACERHVLTFKDALSSKGAYANNTYSNADINFNKGNIKVFINGIRQPFGAYSDVDGNAVESYKIIDSHTIQILSPLVGGQGGNLGDDTIPLFPIDPYNVVDYFKIIDEITIELRKDLTLRELTLPLKYGQTTFGVSDGLPEDLFKTKDSIMIYINGYCYGNSYKNEDKTITLLDSKIEKLIDTSGKNYITFEWR